MGRKIEDDILSNLNKYFNYETLNPDQLIVIHQILQKKDVVVCKESGFGKSLCYQLSGLMRSGIVVVITSSTLLAKEKCRELAYLNIKHTCLTGNAKMSNNYKQDLRNILRKKHKALDEIRNFVLTKPKFLYVTVEYYLSSNKLQQAIKDLYKKELLQTVVFHDLHGEMQPDNVYFKYYFILGQLRETYSKTSFLCFVKPMSKEVLRSIINILHLRQPYVLNEPSINENLSFSIMYMGELFYLDILVEYIKSKYLNENGLIYCRSKEDCLILFKKLGETGITNVVNYSDRSEDEKSLSKLFTSNVIVICVSGMSLDISLPQIDFVLHTSLPSSLDVYYQEASNACRGVPRECVIFYGSTDGDVNLRRACEAHRDQVKGANAEIKRQAYSGLKCRARAMFDVVVYAENSFLCRQAYLLKYFNEENIVPACGLCDVCKIVKDSFVIDMSYCLKKILMAVWAINKQQAKNTEKFYNVNANDFVDLLVGSAKQEFIDSWLTKEWFFASFSSWDKGVLQRFVFALFSNNFLAVNHVFDHKREHFTRNLIITAKGQMFVKLNHEFNLAFSRKDAILTKWLSLEKMEQQFKQDLESVALYYKLHKSNDVFDLASYILDLLKYCPETWEQFRKIRFKYTQNEKCEFDEDLFTVCLTYHQLITKYKKLSNHEPIDESRFQIQESPGLCKRLFE